MHIKYLKSRQLEDLIEDGSTLINFMEVVKEILSMSKLLPNATYCGLLTNGYSIAQNILKFRSSNVEAKD